MTGGWIVPVISVDPGVLSGIVTGTWIRPGEFTVDEWHELGQQDTCDLVAEWIAAQDGRGIVICERFVPRGGAVKFQPASIEIIGVLRWLTQRENMRLVLQSPGDMKMVRKLAVADFPMVGRGGAGHAKDALGHLYLFA